MKKINSTLSSIFTVLVFIICIPFVGQSQTLTATSGSLNFENTNHSMSGISLRQDLTAFLSLGVERIGGQSGIDALKMTSTSLRFSPWKLNTSSVQPWIGGGICYRTLTPGSDLGPDFSDSNSKSDVAITKQTGITIPVSAGIDYTISNRLNTSISVTTHMGNSIKLDDSQQVYEAKTAVTDGLITVLQVGLAFKIVKSVTNKKAAMSKLNEENENHLLSPIAPVLFVDTKGAVVTEYEWNHLFPSLGDPDTYAIDHAVIVSQYSKADYKKMVAASEHKIDMYKNDAVDRVNASILYHMLHDKKQDMKHEQKRDTNTNKKDK